MNCETAYHETGNPRAGLLAAEALERLGRADEVAAWAQRLAGKPEEAAAIRLAGDAHSAAGRLAEARRLHHREFGLRLAAGDAEEIARTAYRLAYLDWRRSQYRSAFDYTEVAYGEAMRAGNDRLAGGALEILYSMLFEIGDLAAAERALDEASALDLGDGGELRVAIGRGLLNLRAGRPLIARAAFESVLAEGSDPPVARSAHENLIEATLELGDIAAARRHADAARELFSAQPTGEALLLALEAKVEAAEGNHAAAVALLDRALATSPSPDLRQEMLYDKGRALEALAEEEAAMAEYRRSIEVVEQSRETLGADDYKEWLLAKRRQPYERLLRLEARAGRALDALETAERIKARTFIDSFYARPADSPGAAAGAPRLLARQGSERLAAMASLLPALRDSPVASRRSIGEIVDSLGDREVLLFIEVADEIWRFQLADKRLAVAALPADVEQVERLVDRLNAAPGDQQTAERLGGILLAGSDLPRGGSRIEVVADGALGRLPFALLRGDGEYLVQKHTISYAPSLTALAAIEEHPWTGGSDALVLADPLADLPQAAKEGREVADLIGGRPLLGEAATFAALTRSTPPRLVHFATHTSLDRGGPTLTLADGAVGAADLLRSRFDPGIVVLATCASASRHGQGLWGSMGAAFLAGGSRAVIASLWSLEDRSARDFVLHFYREGGARDPLGALTATQRAFIAAGKGPETWAPFVLMGSTRALEPPSQKGGL